MKKYNYKIVDEDKNIKGLFRLKATANEFLKKLKKELMRSDLKVEEIK